VRDSILVGIVFAMLILLLFLRNLKVTLIAALAVPGVLAATVLLLYVFHMSFNMMTLGGMAAAVGLIIDDAIVMVEHIMRRLREAAGDHRGRVIRAARNSPRRSPDHPPRRLSSLRLWRFSRESPALFSKRCL
jgi:multidrug efflux pump subunit AcrB